MCSGCGYPAAPGHWTEAGAATPGDRLRLRFRRATLLRGILSDYGLSVHDDGQVPMQLATQSGATVMVSGLDTRPRPSGWRGRPVDPPTRAIWRPAMATEALGPAHPRTVLGGYLGAGKTTWLRHQLHAGAMGRVRVIVNEAAEAPVDDALLGRAAGLTVLAGGPVSGSARAALVAALRDIANDHSAGDHRASDAAPDAVVLETSGLADPAPVVAAIMGDPVLVHHFRLEATLLLVDARHGLTQLAEDPLARRQCWAPTA